jgi:hypothetical protein
MSRWIKGQSSFTLENSPIVGFTKPIEEAVGEKEPGFWRIGSMRLEIQLRIDRSPESCETWTTKEVSAVEEKLPWGKSRT